MNDKEFEVWKAVYTLTLRAYIEGKISYKDAVLAYADNAVREYQATNRNFTRRPSA
jgi:hypothetical protein